MPHQVVILGATGMLGAMVVDVFASDRSLATHATARAKPAAANSSVSWHSLDASRATVAECRSVISGASWVVNCIGITKPLIKDDVASQVEQAIRVNSEFPHLLGRAAEAEGVRVLQIATDCAYSGQDGQYAEDSPHDALDVYGKTKSLGEVSSPNVHHLRASIIGPEPKEHKFLLDWFLGQPSGATLNGFVNHEWNGVTTLAFAKVALGIVKAEPALPKLHHLVPQGSLTKADMLAAFARAYSRSDISINNVKAETVVNRTLRTKDVTLNRALWQNGGYVVPPTVEDMIIEMSAFKPQFGRAMAS